MQRSSWQLVLGLALLSLPLPAEDLSRPPAFRDLSFPEALQAAAAEEKVVMMDFYRKTCAPCRRLKETTWVDPQVVAWLTEKTVPIEVDASDLHLLVKRYRVESYPTIVFVDRRGLAIGRLEGYKNPERFLAEASSLLTQRRGPGTR